MRIRLHLTATTGLRISAVLTLVALALMVWSLLDPTPLPVMIAMSVGQLLGTIAFAIFGLIVFEDLARRRAERRSIDRFPLVDIELPKPPASEDEGRAREPEREGPKPGEDAS
jgi:hypothetical protein